VMPYQRHQVFKQPRKKDTVIWRYLEFTKFVSLLDSKSLFFQEPTDSVMLLREALPDTT
jgi:hypothetical protein